LLGRQILLLSFALSSKLTIIIDFNEDSFFLIRSQPQCSTGNDLANVVFEKRAASDDLLAGCLGRTGLKNEGN
jgi:hypothetical protein